jgi:hypothetical protein
MPVSKLPSYQPVPSRLAHQPGFSCFQGRFLSSIFVCSFALTGCGPHAFVGQQLDFSGRDQREDLVLVGVDARISSGALEVRRIQGTEARVDDSLGTLRLRDVLVHSNDENGQLQGITEAGEALALILEPSTSNQDTPPPQPSTSDGTPLGRNDIAFQSGVVHRVPSTTGSDQLRLTTERLLWEQNKALFRAPGQFEVVMAQQPGNSAETTEPITVIMRGRSFASTANMTRWNILSGVMVVGGDESDRDPKMIALERARLLEEFVTIAAEIPENFEPPPPVSLPEEVQSSETPSPQTEQTTGTP